MYWLFLLIIPVLLLLFVLSLRVELSLCICGYNAVIQAGVRFLYFFRLNNLLVVNIISFKPVIYIFGRKIKLKKQPGHKKKDGKKIRKLLKHIKVYKIEITGDIGRKDAADTALLYGAVNAVINSLAAAVCLNNTSKVSAAFGKPVFKLKINSIIGLLPANIISVEN